MADKDSVSLVPSQVGSDTKGRRFCCCLGHLRSALMQESPWKFCFSIQRVGPCILLRDCCYLSTTEVAKAREFGKFACC